MTIQQLSKEIGIGIDTLRIWERRYGYPIPTRSARGHRSYSADQVGELRIVKKLQSLGYRPGKIFTLSSAERRELLMAAAEQERPPNRALQSLTKDFSPGQIDGELREQLQKLGLISFIHQYALPLLQALDQGWTEGSLSIAREHLISDRLEQLLREQLATERPANNQKQLLFLTLSGERHKLGLLLAAALFHAEGIKCILLNQELPLSEVPLLASDLQVDGVALSFSFHYSTRQAKNDLASLRNQLAPQFKLIAGGQAVQGGIQMQNLTICTALEQIPEVCRKLFV
ncbi:MerR family transcriptional regulator [Deltaproteobacteria bacterium IMCC39524]|nr:MerR family transcriptional regulator [Deltaproteobacteria bacterium IMCC39524]